MVFLQIIIILFFCILSHIGGRIRRKSVRNLRRWQTLSLNVANRKLKCGCLRLCCSLLFLLAVERKSVLTIRSQCLLVCSNDRWGDAFNEMNSNLELSAEKSNWEGRACALRKTCQDRLVAAYGQNKGEHRKRAHRDYSEAFSMFAGSVKSITLFKDHKRTSTLGRWEDSSCFLTLVYLLFIPFFF